MHEQEDVSLANLKNGEVVGLADFKLKELYADIQDPNKSGEARELTIKIKIKTERKPRLRNDHNDHDHQTRKRPAGRNPSVSCGHQGRPGRHRVQPCTAVTPDGHRTIQSNTPQNSGRQLSHD